jgi:hypothetical protein
MIELDEHQLRERLRPLADDQRFRDAIANVTTEPLLLSLFLMGVSQSEGLDEAEVAAIGTEEIVRLVRGLRRSHGAGMRAVVEELFPEFFDHGQYRYEDNVFGRDDYLAVREANRRRLRERGRYSPLNLHLTTSFGQEMMADVLHGTVGDALARSRLSHTVTEKVTAALARGRGGTAADAGPIAQHNALLATDRRALSPAAVEAVEGLASLTPADYVWTAELAVREMVAAYVPYADAGALRARLAGR